MNILELVFGLDVAVCISNGYNDSRSRIQHFFYGIILVLFDLDFTLKEFEFHQALESTLQSDKVVITVFCFFFKKLIIFCHFPLKNKLHPLQVDLALFLAASFQIFVKKFEDFLYLPVVLRYKQFQGFDKSIGMINLLHLISNFSLLTALHACFVFFSCVI